jgi:manganese transport protein
MNQAKRPNAAARLMQSIGPALIVACVVLGPGSIVSNSKVGWQFGYDMLWVVLGATALMIGLTALSARLGVLLEHGLCEELSRQAGRFWGVTAGVCMILVCGSFQFGNNLGVLYAIEPFLDGTRLEGSATFPVATLIILNGVTILALHGLPKLYQPVERLMKLLVGLMLAGFAVNMVLAKPSILAVLAGFIPSLPAQASETLLPRAVTSASGATAITDHLWPVQALIGTTFSVAGAFYQAYLVRQKGWTREHVKEGLRDTVLGIGALGLMSLLIMITSAAVLHDNPNVASLGSAADVARQLQPLFGMAATALFCAGIFAGAFSSFLVNAMVGGAMLSDSLGKGGTMDQPWPKAFTTVVLLAGMLMAIGVKASGLNTGSVIIFAQAITVLVNPLLAGSMLWLASRPALVASGLIPGWILRISQAGFGLVLLLSLRTGYRIFLQLTQLP